MQPCKHATQSRTQCGRPTSPLGNRVGVPPPAESGEHVIGVYRRRLSLASGRFAMIDNGLGFQLVPWIPSLERELGRQVNGIAGPGGVEWSFGRSATFPFNPPISTPSCA